MKDTGFTFYGGAYSYFHGTIKNGCLELISEIDGDMWSEVHYYFSKEETDKLFSIISLEDFIALGKEKHLYGVECFLNDNNIKYEQKGI